MNPGSPVTAAAAVQKSTSCARACSCTSCSSAGRLSTVGLTCSSASAVARIDARKLTVIDGGCSCMFNPIADAEQKAMRFVFTLRGHVPRPVG